MSYEAIVCKISTEAHPNADRLLIGRCLGYQVIVGKDTKDGELGLFFGAGGQISQEFAEANDLIRRKDKDGKRAGGYFEQNRRVRAIKLRGVMSDGFWIPISSLEFTGVDTSDLKEGQSFSKINGISICSKYVTPQTSRVAKKRRGRSIRETEYFPMFRDIGQLRSEMYRIETFHPSVVYISEKVHGTSHRFGNVYGRDVYYKFGVHLPFLRRERTVRKQLSGSRRVILSGGIDEYYRDPFRGMAVEQIEGRLRTGEIVYFEIVGYTTNGRPIMSPQQTRKVSGLEQYPDKMVYHYGCTPGQHRVIVYHMKMVNEDGYIVDMPWWYIVKRCREMELDHVPVLETMISPTATELADAVSGLVHGPSTFTGDHIREGVVVRIESSSGVTMFKHKSWEFGVLEGYLKDRDDYVDIEEVS